MTTKRSIQLHEYRQAIIGIRNVAAMDKELKLRPQADIATLVQTGTYIATLEAERAALLDRIKSLSEDLTMETRYRKMIQARWQEDLLLWDNFLNESLAMWKEAEPNPQHSTPNAQLKAA